MSKPTSRREFIQLSTVGTVAAISPALRLHALPADSVPRSGGVWITDSQRQMAKMGVEWRPTAQSPQSQTVTVSSGEKYQPILGFGAAFTDASCYTFHRLEPAVREELFHRLFHTSEMGLSVCRTCIGASDYSTEVFSYDDGERDPELSRFSIKHDQAYVLPILREAIKANPDLFLFSSPWSPPGWIKSNNSMLGGNMQRHDMAAYAQYFVKFLRAYENEGVPVKAITVQNEVDTDQDGRMPACSWPMEYEADFVRQFLGPAFEKNSVQTKIWLIDHNYNLWGRAIAELETPGVQQYSNAIAWHGYVGEPEWMMRVQKAFPDVEMYWTEGGPDYRATDYATDWAKWSEAFIGILRNGCRSITGWNLALDEHGKPNIGPFSCGGMVTIHSRTREVSYSGQYWALAHFSKFIRRGALRIESSSRGGVANVALQNPDGTYVLVLANKGPEKSVLVAMNGQQTAVEMSKDSVATLVWS